MAGWLAHKNKQIGRLSEITANESEFFSNDFALNEAKIQAAKSERESGQKTVLDNRDVFNGLLDSQVNHRANGNVPSVTLSNQEFDVREDSKATKKELGTLSQLPAQSYSTQPLGEKSGLQREKDVQDFTYRGRRLSEQGESELLRSDDSKDSKNLANLYKNKL
ncbi:MAG TPA: hypothetical protein VM260_03140, partial [Pirellula sp.]|nr:hypothetical protein [Pirellula sp.]